METKKSGYSSRFALICVLIGGSVGTGNLWRFPRLVANTGGAAFIIVMTVCVFLTALPLLYVENFMGRATRHSAPGAFHDICGKKYTCLGMFSTLAYLLMLAYYLVVLAWCLRYAGMSLTGGYFGVDKESLFTTVTTANPATIAVWAVALILVYFGIAKQEALEKVSSILMPCLFGLLIGLVVYALTRKGAYEGLKYTFTLDPKSLVDINIWKEALTQVAWSIGPGTMMMITAAMVSHKDGDITLNSHVQAFGDMTVAMLGTVCVLPIIFAQSIASLPPTIILLCGGSQDSWFMRTFDSNTIPYAIVYFLLILFFAYFYATIQFNPVEVANNLKKNGGFIPGYRPGKPTSEFIQKVLNKVTLFGAVYLGIIACVPIIISACSKAAADTGISLGGTSIIIVVGVAIETVQALESQMLMRHYKGFLE